MLVLLAGCASQPSPAPEPVMTTAEVKPVVVPDIEARLQQLPATRIDYDRTLLNDEERRVVAKLIEAARIIDSIFWLQVSEKNREWQGTLVQAATWSPKHAAALQYFIAMKGPWDRLDDDKPFVEGVGEKPTGAAFYPPDMSKEEFDRWIAGRPQDKETFQGLFNVIRRDGSRLVAVPYSHYYSDLLNQAAARLREAAAMTSNASLLDFLNKIGRAHV